MLKKKKFQNFYTKKKLLKKDVHLEFDKHWTDQPLIQAKPDAPVTWCAPGSHHNEYTEIAV